MKRYLLIVMALVALGTPVSAQNVLDGVYVKEHIPTKKLIQYPHLREADVMWEKRIWRVIDTREKINFPLYYPLKRLTDRENLFDILRKHVLAAEIIPYNYVGPDLTEYGGDMFFYPISPSLPDYREQANALFGEPEAPPTTPMVDQNGNQIVLGSDEYGFPIYQYHPADKVIGKTPRGGDSILPGRDTIYYSAEDIIGWEIKEDWFFEKQRSVMDVRIIGIAPIVGSKNVNSLGVPRKLFWIYFPELRYIIQNYFVYNRQNDAQRMSFDDLFWKRMFNSYIKKESNIYDRQIIDYTSGIDALLESEKIRLQMQDMEHDVWDI
ncbi:MAG: gliding motility protein GldN [Flavobacteriales bacterium]